MPHELPSVTRLSSLAMSQRGSGISPYQDMPLGALMHFAPYAGYADDFVFYEGPVAAATAAGLTVGLTGTGAIAQSTTHLNGAGVLRHTLPAAADAVSFETDLALVEIGSKQIKAAVVVQASDMANADLHFGLGTVAIVHGTADSADMVEVKWDAANSVIELRTQKDTGGVTTTAASTDLSALVAGRVGLIHLGIVVAPSAVVAVVSLGDVVSWQTVASLLLTDASVPTAGDPLGMYLASVRAAAASTVDHDFWSFTVER